MQSTPLPIIAAVSRIVINTCNLFLGNRTEAPLVVASGIEYALSLCKIKSRCMYGWAAWIELTDENSPYWAGVWEPGVHFWVHTEFAEVVDLNVFEIHKTHDHRDQHNIKTILSAPLLWSNEIPPFYRYEALGIAHIDLSDPKEKQIFAAITAGIETTITQTDLTKADAQDFPYEPILCSNRKLLDDQQQSFARFDRALRIQGIPHLPEFFKKEQNKKDPTWH